MTLKAVEMQIALPRIGDAGNLQNQLLQKPMNDQAALTAATMKQMEEQRKKSNKLDEMNQHVKANKDGRKNGQMSIKSQGIDKTSNGKSDEIGHPFKGHHIDLSL